MYYPTPMHVARAMLRVAGVTQADTVYDLGCGDGRIVITAAEEFGARGLGVELDPVLAQAAEEAVRKKGLTERVQIRHGDVRGLDASGASVVTLYLNEKANRQLLDGLMPGSLRQGTRVVSLFFPVQVCVCVGQGCTAKCFVLCVVVASWCVLCVADDHPPTAHTCSTH